MNLPVILLWNGTSAPEPWPESFQ